VTRRKNRVGASTGIDTGTSTSTQAQKRIKHLKKLLNDYDSIAIIWVVPVASRKSYVSMMGLHSEVVV
jgi:hypothetical protein